MSTGGKATPGTNALMVPGSSAAFRKSLKKKPFGSSPHALVKEKPMYRSDQARITA